MMQADQQAKAAELAKLQGTPLAEAIQKTEQAPPSRPQLGDALRDPAAARAQAEAAAAAASSSPSSGDATSPQAIDKKPDASSGTDAGQTASENPSRDGAQANANLESSQANATGVNTIGDLNVFREAIRQAVSETNDMARRASRISNATPTARRPGTASSESERQRLSQLEAASRSQRSNRGQVVDVTSLQVGTWNGSGSQGGSGAGLQAANAGGGEMARGLTSEKRLKLSSRMATANALPGRMLTDDSSRQGFLYLDTWYIIGPWNNWSRANFELVHPPEQNINLDAEYYDGKFANKAKHPDKVLRWQFVQSDRIAIQPPRPTHSATYYAYTEVYSDRTREMLVAVASDDMAKVWLNGDVIWTDLGQSGWNLNEGFRRVVFKEGFNTVLVRFENGPTYVAFSVLLCPPSLMPDS